MGVDEVRHADLQALSKAVGGDLSRSAAAMMRLQAHSLSAIAATLEDMSTKLRTDADRVEHGGALPDLHVVEEDTDEGLVLPSIVKGATGWAAADTHGIPHADLDAFLAQFHARWLESRQFLAAYREMAAGERPSHALAHKVIGEITALEAQQ